MKRTMLFLGIMGLVLGFGASALAIGLCSYVSPETNLQSIGLSMSYHYFDDFADAGVETSVGLAGLDYNLLHDSPDFGYTLTANGELLLADFAPVSGLADVAGTYRYYFTQDAPAFGFGGIEASVASGQLQPAVYIDAGLGYGRFSDVTPLAKAVKIEKQLLRVNAIPGPLGDSALLEIAQMIGSGEYATADEKVAAVVNRIQAASGVTLNPRQVLKVEDLVLATGDVRYCGWAVQAGVGYQLVDPYNNPRTFLVTASADAAFAPNPDAQVLFHAGLSGPLNILDQNTLRLRASYSYVLSEITSLRASYTVLRVQPLGDPASTSQTAALLLGFDIGSSTNLGLQASLSKPADATAWSLDASVSAAVTFDY
ncbi:MAG: hypothetical protein NTY63_06900 [Candidatus Bipolaricaulota bacterium]|nr:hypothetical protein [Candidatus Bipolaricaulota bacterium]